MSLAGSGGGKDAGLYVVARHVADFGNVVLGFTKKKTFRVFNAGKVRALVKKQSMLTSRHFPEPLRPFRDPRAQLLSLHWSTLAASPFRGPYPFVE